MRALQFITDHVIFKLLNLPNEKPLDQLKFKAVMSLVERSKKVILRKELTWLDGLGFRLSLR